MQQPLAGSHELRDQIRVGKNKCVRGLEQQSLEGDAEPMSRSRRPSTGPRSSGLSDNASQLDDGSYKGSSGGERITSSEHGSDEDKQGQYSSEEYCTFLQGQQAKRRKPAKQEQPVPQPEPAPRIRANEAESNVSLDAASVQLVSATGSAIVVSWTTLLCALHRWFSGHAAEPRQNVVVQAPPTKFVRKTASHCDGYKWRKYGQKLLAGSRLYREYLRCTYAGCPAKKHVEICPTTGEVLAHSSNSTQHNHAPVLEVDKYDICASHGEVASS